MENKAHALAAGLFVLLLGAAMVIGVWWFSESREDTRDYELLTQGSVAGLNPQSQVRFRGIAAGKVTAIGIDPLDVRNLIVTIRLRADLPITAGTRASLGTQGVTGLAFVRLDDKGEDLSPLLGVDGHLPRLVLQPGIIDQIADATFEIMKRLQMVSSQIIDLFDDQNLARLNTSMRHLESTLNGLDETFAKAPQTLARIDRFFSAGNSEHFDSLLTNLEQASDGMLPVVTSVDTLLQRFDHLANSLDDRVSTALDKLTTQTLPMTENLLIALTDTSSQLGRLLDEIEATPQVLLSGRAQASPGPGEKNYVQQP